MAVNSVENEQKVVILLGPPGSGKGTQAELLIQELKIPHISTGDLFRANISKNTPLGQKAKTFMDAGRLVPDEVVLDMLFDRVSNPDSSHGYLLDGFPRTIPQAEALDRFLKGKSNIIALNLQIPDEIIIKRISGRLTCEDCHTMYNTYYTPPTASHLCDKCAGKLYQRTDDSAEVVQERLRVYNDQTSPLIEFYDKKGVLFNFDSNRDPHVIFREILQKI